MPNEEDAGLWQRLSRERIAVVVAHPDDETIGLGGHLAEIAANCAMVHVTDGAPLDMRDAIRQGFTSREAYSRARRWELHRALRLCNIGMQSCFELRFPDQTTWRSLPELTTKLIDILQEQRPTVVITHPYEGGHPDHDSTAFAAHRAKQALGFALYEFTSYHAGANGAMQAFEFLPSAEPVSSLALSEEQRAVKKAMFDSFHTQRDVLGHFPIAVEKLRQAPQYDFTQPPHSGALFFERFDWGVTGEKWRQSAAAALDVMLAARTP